MKRPSVTACVFCAAAWIGCSGGNDEPADMGTTQNDGVVTNTDVTIAASGYATCPRSTRVGGFEGVLADTYSTVQGQVAGGVNPNNVLEVESSSGPCQLLRPPDLFCDPPCSAGMTCGAGGSCVASPSNQDVGEVTITGLTAPITMAAMEPVYFYNFTGDLPHPAFSAGTQVTLTAAGAGFAGFTLQTSGVDPLVSDITEVPIDVGTGAEITWTASAPDDDVRVEVELNIANHGGTPGRIECTIEDTGSFTIPAVLVDALLAGGFSGFPSLRFTRQGAAATNVGPSCVDFRLESEILVPVSIPGLVSCSNDADCTAPQTCLVDLTCG